MLGDLERWQNFFVAEVGASAALAGLLVVAASINLSKVLTFPHLPRRVLEALMVIVAVLLVSTLALIPDQPRAFYGAEFAAVGATLWVANSVLLLRGIRAQRQYGGAMWRILFNQVPPLPYVVGGVLLIADQPQGIYWIAPGVVACFVSGLFSAWVLLVEIQR